MFESPLLQKMIAQKLHKAVEEALKARFGSVPRDVNRLLREIRDETKLTRLIGIVVKCPDMEAFRDSLLS